MQKHKRKEFTLPALLLFGSGFALITVVATAMALAIIACFTGDPTALTGAFSLLSLIIAGAVSGFITSRANGDGGALVGILSALICSALMLAIGLVWKGGLLPFGAILNIAVFAVVSVGASLLGKKRVRIGRKHRYS